MKNQKIKTENDLANFIVENLQNDGWTCYEEVMPHRGGQIADIVAVKNNYIRVIETKMSATLALIEQAYHWHFYAHSVFVALYRFQCSVDGKLKGYKHARGRWAFERLCQELRIGILSVTEKQNSFDNYFLTDVTSSGMNRNPLPDLKNALCEEMLAKGNAGTTGGKHWTPFKRTCAALLKVVRENPGIQLREAINKIDHHYSKDSTAVACLGRGIYDGIVPGIQTERKGRKIYLVENTDSEKK